MGDYKIKSRIWIDADDQIFLGNGRIELLENIAEYGSINKAAKVMGISYKKAWMLIDGMNKQYSEPLIITSTGGKGGGGTRVTKAGKKAIKAFRKFDKKCRKLLDAEMKKSRFFQNTAEKDATK